MMMNKDRTQMNNDEFITVEGRKYVSNYQLADILKRTTGTLARWHQQGEGPARLKMGNQILYSVTAVARWLDEQEAVEKVKQTKIIDPLGKNSIMMVTK
jgi:hypothetical protein